MHKFKVVKVDEGITTEMEVEATSPWDAATKLGARGDGSNWSYWSTDDGVVFERDYPEDKWMKEGSRGEYVFMVRTIRSPEFVVYKVRKVLSCDTETNRLWGKAFAIGARFFRGRIETSGRKKNFFSEIKLAKKTWQTVRSGYVTLQVRGVEEDWLSIEVGDDYDPYYVCPIFQNGRHIPLPLILGVVSPLDSTFNSRLQDHVLRMARLLGSLTEAKKACYGYLKTYKGETDLCLSKLRDSLASGAQEGA